MTTLSQDSGDASAGTGEPGDEASIGDRRREGWPGRPAFQDHETSGAVMHAGCCQRMASGDQAPVPWRLSHSVILLAGLGHGLLKQGDRLGRAPGVPVGVGEVKPRVKGVEVVGAQLQPLVG